jgi:hypothetical protein
MLEWPPRGNRRERIVKRRMVVVALSVILALGVAAPIASAKDSSGDYQSLSDLTAAW